MCYRVIAVIHKIVTNTTRRCRIAKSKTQAAILKGAQMYINFRDSVIGIYIFFNFLKILVDKLTVNFLTSGTFLFATIHPMSIIMSGI